MRVNRSSSLLRKPPKESYQFPAGLIQSSIESAKDGMNQEATSPVIREFRLSNPNLQPLSDVQRREVDHWRRKSVDQVYMTPPPSSSGHKARHSLGSSHEMEEKTRSVNRLSNITTQTSNSAREQKFWKYHILEVGEKFLYLTTNPDSKHLYCRNAPGIHVEIRGNYKKYHQIDHGFQLVFKDQTNDSVFMTVTRKVTDRSDEIYIESLGVFYIEKGNLIESSKPKPQHNIATSIPIKELQSMRYEKTPAQPIRYEIMKDGTYHVGSIPQYRTGTNKLKNKRFVFCTSPTKKMMALFRPRESRTKKKILKKMNTSTRPLSMYSFLERSETKANDLEQFYTAGDGLRPENPIDDTPNDQKLGWLTIFDDPVLQKPGLWEVFVGSSSAVGYASIIDERLRMEKIA